MTSYSLFHCRRLINTKIVVSQKTGCNHFSVLHSPVADERKFLKNVWFHFSPAVGRTLCKNINEKIDGADQSDRKVLKVAIIGVPNAGKSTLINQIVGRNIFAVSSKVHTTRCRARAVMVMNETQLVFLDTPGLVSVGESVKHHLESSFMVDGIEAVREADVIGVIHDVSNKYTIFKLDPKVLRLLLLFPRKHAFLILNKIDTLKSKRQLLDCVDSLTKGRGPLEKDCIDDILRTVECKNLTSEQDIRDLITDQTGWPLFKDIFMISAMCGDGVGDIQIHLLQMAKPGEWLFDKSVVTDQKDVDVVEQTVFAKLLDHLPNVIPYNLKVQLEYFQKSVDGSVSAVVLITAKKEKIMKLVLGKGGSRIKRIAADVEQCLRQFFLNDIHVKLVLEVADPKLDELVQKRT